MTEKKTETASQRKRRAQKRAQTHRSQKSGAVTPVGAANEGASTKSTHKRSNTRRGGRRRNKNASAPGQSGQPGKTGQSRPSAQKRAAKHAPRKSAGKSGNNKSGNSKRGGNRRRGGGNNLQTNAERILTALSNPGSEMNKKIPPIGKGTLRVIPIGGNEEVGRNMNMFEYENDIVIIDMGLQFPEEDMHGIDYIVPNVSYLKGKEKNVRAVIFTHGHLDHIGAAPILLKQLDYPPIIARDLTLALIKKKLEDIDPGSSAKVKAISIKDVNQTMRLGAFQTSFFEVEHSIMDCMGIALSTPAGTIMHLGDWMINRDPKEGEMITYEHLAKLPEPRILLLESLAATKTTPSSEKIVQGNLEDLIDRTKGRLIIATFASQIKRIKLLLEYAEKAGKKVALDGYSMRTNVDVAQQLGYFKFDKNLLIPIGDIDKYPDNRILILCTGAQGEHNAVLNRIVTGNHRFIKIKKADTVVFSSSVIPGNERSVQRVKDNLYRMSDNVLHSEIMDIHIGGHGTTEDIKDVVKMSKPNYLVPVYANHYMLKEAVNRATEVGFDRDSAFIVDNGGIIEFYDRKLKKEPKILKEKADASYVFVDGLGVGDIGHIVLRDRQMLSADGMYMMTILINAKSKQIVGNIQVTSRGFVVVKDNFDLVNETKRKVEKIIKETTSKEASMDWKVVEKAISDQVGQYLFQKTARRPMVLPIVMEV